MPKCKNVVRPNAGRTTVFALGYTDTKNTPIIPNRAVTWVLAGLL